MYNREAAEQAVIRKLENLRNEPILRKITMSAERIGFSRVVEQMCRFSGPMHKQYNKTGGYIVPVDDLRRCVFDFRSAMKKDDYFIKTLRTR